MKYEIFDNVIPIPTIPAIGDLWKFTDNDDVYLRIDENELYYPDIDPKSGGVVIYSVNISNGKVFSTELNQSVIILKYRLSIERTEK